VRSVGGAGRGIKGVRRYERDWEER
jgi:hypothetical protein